MFQDPLVINNCIVIVIFDGFFLAMIIYQFRLRSMPAYSNVELYMYGF